MEWKQSHENLEKELVAEAGEKKSFSKAAQRLDVEQAYLSKTIAALESALNVELFDRTRRPPILTAAGVEISVILDLDLCQTLSLIPPTIFKY